MPSDAGGSAAFEYPTLLEVLEIHKVLLERFGGRPGVLDPGLIESALYRPQTGYYRDLIQQAAALWESLSQTHPFVDGNKRAAFAVMDVFLRLNGMRVAAEPVRAYDELNALYESGRFRLAELESWLRANTGPRAH